MSQTKAQRRKQQKKTAKAKANRKRRNVEHNQAPVKWRLDVYHKDRWVTDFRRFRKWEQVQRHLDETEEARKKGIEIVQARIISLETGQAVKEIEPSPAKIEDKATLPDTLAGKKSKKFLGVL